MKRSKNVFTEKVVSRMEDIGKVDIIAGISSLNSEKTIGKVIREIDRGFTKYFPNKKSIIVVADSSGERSKTHKVIRETSRKTETTVLSLLTPRLGKGEAILDLIETGRLLDAKVVCLFDSDLKSITPEWIKNLAEPILSGQFNFVTPNYVRAKFDGTITNSIVYPLTTALYGLDVRQPIGGEFGISKSLINEYLNNRDVDENISLFGIDIWLTTTALCRSRGIAQANLGAKIHDVSVKDKKHPEKSIGKMFKQVVGTTFKMIETHTTCWMDVKEIYHAPYYGPEVHVEPQKVKLDFNSLYDAMKRTSKDEISFWEKEVDKKLYKRIEKVINSSKKDFQFPQELWVEIVYEFLLIYHKKKTKEEKKRVIESMVPIYLARVAALDIEIKDYTNSEAEAKFQNLVRLFANKKDYLIESWGKERSLSGLNIRKRLKEVVGLD